MNDPIKPGCENTVLGYHSDVSYSSACNTILGVKNNVDGNYNSVTGVENKITGHHNTVIGSHNSIDGNYNIVIGNHITCKGNYHYKKIMNEKIYKNWLINQFDMVDDVKGIIKNNLNN